jgi:integrase
LTAFRTGLRLGELLGLHWSDIDWQAGTIHVQRSFNKKKIKPTKVGINQRVNMSEQLSQVLKKRYEARSNDSDIVFPLDGGYRAQNTVRKAFKAYIKAAGTRNIRFFDIRHTYASILISNGATLAYIKDQLGHSSIKATGDIYAHMLPNSMRDMINLLDDPS